MEHKSIGRIPVFVSLLESCHDKVNICFAGQMPWEHFPWEQVNHNTEIVPFSSGFQVGYIADPYKIWGILRKPLLQMVGTFLLVWAAAGRFGVLGWHFRQFHAAHQPVHSSDTDADAIVTLKDALYFISAQALIKIRIDVQDHTFKALILANAGKWLACGNAYSKCSCLHSRHGRGSWDHAENEACGQHLIVVWVRHEDGNRFF